MPALADQQRHAQAAQHQPSTMCPGRKGKSLMLFPGEWHVGAKVARLRTLLGSCVGVVLWHPRQRIGAMCHYLLPSRRRRANEPREGRFGDEAMDLMCESLAHHGLPLAEYEAHLYGGADTLPGHISHRAGIGERNIEIGWSLIEQYGFTLQAVDVGDSVPRTVTLDLQQGRVDVRRGATRPDTGDEDTPP